MVIRFFKRLTCKHSYVITSERRNICTHEDMYELTCIKCGKTISINLADPIEIMKNDLNILERNNKIFKFKPY